MANLCELVAGTMTEVSVPASMRWIPREMTIAYRAKAETDVSAAAVLTAAREGEAQDLVVPVHVRDGGSNVVLQADITMYVSPREKRGG